MDTLVADTPAKRHFRGDDMSDQTGKALVEFWSWAADKGLMNANTAGGMRAAVTKVLSVEDAPDEIDLTKIDVEHILKRFENTKKKDLTPGSLETYKGRFRQAIKSYADYLRDPGGWRWGGREKAASGDASGPKKKRAAAAPVADVPDMSEPSPATQRGKSIDFQLPLREGVIAHLWLPADLKASEVKRLHAFMSTLVLSDEA